MATKKIKRLVKLGIILAFVILIVSVIVMATSKLHSRENILARLISGIDNLNYNYTTNNDENKIQVVGKYEKIITPEKEIYSDYESKETKEVYLNSSYMEEYSNNGIEDIQYYNEFIKGYFDATEYYKYKYKGKEKVDGKKCTLVELIYDDEIAREEIYYWIDDSTNLIYKIEKYQYDIEEDKMEKNYDRTFNFDIASNKPEDIKISEETLTTHSSDTNN